MSIYSYILYICSYILIMIYVPLYKLNSMTVPILPSLMFPFHILPPTLTARRFPSYLLSTLLLCFFFIGYLPRYNMMVVTFFSIRYFEQNGIRKKNYHYDHIISDLKGLIKLLFCIHIYTCIYIYIFILIYVFIHIYVHSF